MMVLVIGYGNPLRGDDGAGPVAAQRLAAAGQHPLVDIRACHQLTPELAEPVSRASLVVFIDAAVGGTPGVIAQSEVLPEAPEGIFTHHVTPATLLAAARDLYGACPRGVLLSIHGADFGLGDELSPHVENALPKLIQRAQALIDRELEASKVKAEE
ncbi:MAG: hydrogenase maturation protease [Chloroflexota bacterium]|nr:MAG: hypothetical protein DIU68_08495 [Chloroflexota bacterium]